MASVCHGAYPTGNCNEMLTHFERIDEVKIETMSYLCGRNLRNQRSDLTTVQFKPIWLSYNMVTN